MRRQTAPTSLLLAFVLLSDLGAQDGVQEAASVAETKVDLTLISGMKYRCVGPSRGGRVTTVAGVAQRPGEFYMGATGGGVWKTTNFGVRWRNVSDGFFTTPSIGAIRVAPSNPDVVYAGTGSDGLRSNVITGRGVYKSTDAGKTWQCVGLEKVGQIGAVEVDPTNPDVVWVAAIGQAFQPNMERGVFRSRDGGKTWKKVLFVSDKIGIVDLELNPADPDEIYACSWRAERKPWTIISGAEGCGLYKSTDGGESWRRLTKGLPSGVVGKSDLAVSRANPRRVYALIEASKGQGGVYRSDDQGETFERVNSDARLVNRPFYYCNIDADPSNAEMVYVNTRRFYRSSDGGKRWRTMSTPHGDNHDVWIHPDNPKLMIQCNDGGANVSIDGGRTWSTQSNQPTAELYQVAVDDRFPYWLYAGQQDNSTIRVPSNPPYPAPAGPRGYWQSIGGCETGPAIPKPGDPDIVYANCKGRFGRFNFRTGQEKHYYVGAANMYGHNPRDLKYRFQRVAPIAVSPHDPKVVYHASQFLHRSRNEGEIWTTISPDLTAFEASKQVISGSPITRDITGEEFYSTIYAVAESKLKAGVIWVGANDGPVHVTRDGGKTWKNVTPPMLQKGGRVQTVEPSPHEPGKAYVCVLRYQLGDWRPHVYRTGDYGATWTWLTDGQNGIPKDTPTRVVREDPKRVGLLYAGTEFGVYVSFDDGGKWHSLQLNLPVTPVTDMRVHRGDLVLSTMGRSFWILDDIAPVRQLSRTKLQPDLHVFQPSSAIRFRTARSRGGSGVQYLLTGAYVDYWLAKDTPQLTVEVLDHAGRVVRKMRVARTRRRAPADATGGMRPVPPVLAQRLSGTAGAHRFRWDLRHQGPKAVPATGNRRGGRRTGEAGGRRGRGSRGPVVAPGRYSLRFRAGSVTRTVPMDVRIDPRLAADGVTPEHLVMQETLALQVRDTITRARAVAARIQKQKAAGKDDKERDRLAKLEAELVTAKGAYPQPMLQDQLRYLASMLDRADQKPGQDAYTRHKELVAWLDRIVAALKWT